MYALTKTVPQLQKDVSPAKPLYVYWASPNTTLKNMRILQKAHIPCYHSTLETVRVAAAISRYGTKARERGA